MYNCPHKIKLLVHTSMEGLITKWYYTSRDGFVGVCKICGVGSLYQPPPQNRGEGMTNNITPKEDICPTCGAYLFEHGHMTGLYTRKEYLAWKARL